MHRIEIPPPEVFADAEALEAKAAESAGELANAAMHEVVSLLRVTQYYKALLDRLMQPPTPRLLALAERYVQIEETGQGPQPLGEDEISDRFEVVAEAYRYYKGKYDAARSGLGICTVGHEALMRKPQETTAEYLARLAYLIKDFGAQVTAQIGKARFGLPEDHEGPVATAEEIDDEIMEGPGDRPRAEPVPDQEEPGWQDDMVREYGCSFLMAGIRFEQTVVKVGNGIGVERRVQEGGDEVYVVFAPAAKMRDADKLAELCNMTPLGEWKEVSPDEAPEEGGEEEA